MNYILEVRYNFMDKREVKHLAAFIVLGIIAATIFVLLLTAPRSFEDYDRIEDYFLLGFAAVFFVLGIIMASGRWTWIISGDEYIDRGTLMKRRKVVGLLYICGGFLSLLIFVTSLPFYYINLVVVLILLPTSIYWYLKDRKSNVTQIEDA